MADYKNKPWTIRDHNRCSSGWVVRTGADGKAEVLAQVYVLRPVDGAGRLRVAVLDSGHPDGNKWHYSSASGYGYDKLTAALAHMTIGGEELGDHGSAGNRPTIEALCYARGWLYLAP